MSNANYGYDRKNEFGDTLAYKSGSGHKSIYVGTRVCLGKVERKQFMGDFKTALEKWADWVHDCERDAPPEPPAEVKEEVVVPRVSDEMRHEIEELLEQGDTSQVQIAAAYGISEATVSRIAKRLREKQERAAERERIREEERQLRAEHNERERPALEPVPESFLPRVTEGGQAAGKLYAIGTDGTLAYLFTDKRTCERVARMMTAAAQGDTYHAIECVRWEDA